MAEHTYVSHVTAADLPAPPSGRSVWPWTGNGSPDLEGLPAGRSWPKISVVTATYNGGRFLEEAMRSVLLQNYPDFEYIVMDGASSDDSVEIIRRYERHLTHWISEKDNGQSAALNKGFSLASGEILYIVDADDIVLPGAFAAVAKAYLEQDRPSLILGHGYIIDAVGNILSHRRNPNPVTRDTILAWRDNWILCQGVFVPAEAWQKVGGLDERLHYSMDFDLWLALIDMYPFVTIEADLAYCRQHAGSKTTWYMPPEAHAENALVRAKRGDWGGAMERISGVMREYERLSRKLRPFTHNPVYRLARRLMRN